MFHRDYQPIINYDKTPDGILRVRGTVARTGWLQYQNKEGTSRWEYVSPETLFDPVHVDSIGGTPAVLSDHPLEKVTPKNWKQYAVGVTNTTLVTNLDKGIIDVVIIVGDEEAIQSIEDGKTRQLSMGYDAKTLIREGELNRFDQIQRICNHIAIVELGRAGPIAKLHMDSLSNDSWLQVGYDEPSKQQIYDLKTPEKKSWQFLRLTIGS